MTRGVRAVKSKSIFFIFTLLTVFFLSSLVFSQDISREKASFKEELSYTADQTWYAKKDWKNGLSEVTQSRQPMPWMQATWDERVNYFISRLKKGDKKAFLYVEYGLLDGYGNPYSHRSARSYPTPVGSVDSHGVVWKLHSVARKRNTRVENVLTEGNAKTRANVVRAILQGLFNKDPRVRMVAVNLLRRLRPDPSMARDVRRAMLLETVTTERSKWREKDIDIPSIENPRLGWNAVAWSGGGQPTPLEARFRDGTKGGLTDLLNGNKKGLYLQQGLYRRTERNDFPTEVERMDQTTQVKTRQRVWTKSSLLRYGADTQVSGFENHYGLKDVEVMPRSVYLYLDYRDPGTQINRETLYYAYHSVWEEMKKLDLFVTRSVWVARIKRGDIKALKVLSKDSFRTLADQIDGESLTYVPMKSQSFKIFGEAEARAIIVGMLENRVVSTREECIRFLKRLFSHQGTSTATKREIKKALREARRRELIIDTIRGRHVHAELVVASQPDDWWGEQDEIDTSSFATGARGRNLEIYRNQVEFPEETDIIYHDRRKPGQEEEGEEGDDDDDDADDDDDDSGDDDDDDDDADDDDDDDSGDDDDDDDDTASASDGGAGVETSKDLYTGVPRAYGHPLLAKAKNQKGKLTFADVEGYLRLENFKNPSKAKAATTTPESKDPDGDDDDDDDGEGDDDDDDDGEGDDDDDDDGEGDDDDDDDGEGDDDDDDQEAMFLGDEEVRPGQAPGLLNKEKSSKSVEGRSIIATRYDLTRSVEILHSLLLGRDDDLLKASFLDFQNAILILMSAMRNAGPDANFLSYFLAGTSVVNGKGRRFHGHVQLQSELGRTGRARKNLRNLLAGIMASAGDYALGRGDLTARRRAAKVIEKPKKAEKKVEKVDKTKRYAEQAKVFQELRKEYYNQLPEYERGELPPGRSADPNQIGTGPSKRELSERRHGKYYGHGRGGFYSFYDQQSPLGQAEDDAAKIAAGFYQFPTQWRLQRTVLVNTLLKALGDKDPQKRLLVIHLLRRLIPDPTMLPRVNKLLRELETVDKRPYQYIDTILDKAGDLRLQEKIVGHELLKLQRFIVRRILVNKIITGGERDLLKEIPKGSFLTLVVRIDAEWDPFRIPLRSLIPRSGNGSNGMFFTMGDIDVIRGGLENRNFLVQREVARWIVTFYNTNSGFGGGGGGNAKKFIRAIKFAEKRDIVYYERNYVQWKYDASYHRTVYEPNATIKSPRKGANVVGIPVGRVPIRIGTPADSHVFWSIDEDRRIEFVDRYGRSEGSTDKEFLDKPPANADQRDSGDIRKAYREHRKERDAKKTGLGDSARDDKDLDAGGQ